LSHLFAAEIRNAQGLAVFAIHPFANGSSDNADESRSFFYADDIFKNAGQLANENRKKRSRSRGISISSSLIMFVPSGRRQLSHMN
jgi:hypothetical protein